MECLSLSQRHNTFGVLWLSIHMHTLLFLLSIKYIFYTQPCRIGPMYASKTELFLRTVRIKELDANIRQPVHPQIIPIVNCSTAPLLCCSEWNQQGNTSIYLYPMFVFLLIKVLDGVWWTGQTLQNFLGAFGKPRDVPCFNTLYLEQGLRL